MTARCYVCCRPADDNPALDRRSPRCQRCKPAAAHVISMQNDRAVCECGWSIEIGYRLHIARDEACKAHWRDVILQSQLEPLS